MSLSTNPIAPRRFHRATTWAEYVLLLALVGVFFWRGFLPAWKTLNTDFPDYYLAARLYHQGYSLNQIYDWTWIQRQKDHAGIQRPIVTFTLLTPFSLLPVLPFSSLPPLKAKRCWLLVNLVLLGLAGYLLQLMTKLGARRIALLTFLALVPLRTNFVDGQEDVLLLFLLTLAVWFYLQYRPVASGVILSVAAALKIYPVVFVFFFIRKKQWRGAISLLAGTAALWVISAGLFGFETVRIYLTEVLPWPLRAEGQDPYNVAWNSFSALFHRLFVAEPQLNPHPVVHAPAAYAILQPVCQCLIFVPFLWLMSSSRSDPQREKLEWGMFIAMLLILSTNPASYDFNILIVTAIFVFEFLIRAARRREAVALVTLYALVCFPIYRWVPGSPTGWRLVLAFPRLWAMTGLWICLVAILFRSASRRPMSGLRSREAAAFGMIGLALVALGVTLNLRSQRGEFKNYATRLTPGPRTLLATDPAIERGKILFTAMTSSGYDTEILSGKSLSSLTFGPDSFHPATAPGCARGWAEVVSSRSKIVSFALNSKSSKPNDVVVEAEDAEQPVVSADLHWLAFIRETKGRGSLWVKTLQRNPDMANPTHAERRLSPSGFDVLDIAFAPDNRIVFSAFHGGSPALFATRPESGKIVALGGRAPRRYPAFSPDGRWLAFSQLEHGNWQLWVQNLATQAEQRLTNSDCNSIAPAWYPDSKHLVYATDCGRGFGLTALCQIQAVPKH